MAFEDLHSAFVAAARHFFSTQEGRVRREREDQVATLKEFGFVLD